MTDKAPDAMPERLEIVEHSWAETSIYGNKEQLLTCSIEDKCDEDTQDEVEAWHGKFIDLVVHRYNTHTALLKLAEDMANAIRNENYWSPKMEKSLEAYEAFMKDEK